MATTRFGLAGLLRNASVGLHGGVLIAAVAVPVYAVIDAVLAVSTGHGVGASLIDWRRWSLLLGNTAVVVSVAALVAVTLGATLGLLAARTDMPGRRLLLGAALFGACMPVYVTAILLFSLVPAMHLTGSRFACGILYGFVYTPLATLILAAAFRAVDRELEDQTLLDATPYTMLLRVTLPQAGWAVIVVATILALLVGTDFTIADILIVRTFAEECYTQYQLDHARTGPVLTAVPVLGLLAVLIVIVQSRYQLLGEHSPWQGGSPPRLFSLGRARRAAGLGCGTLVAATAGLPVLALVRKLAGPGPSGGVLNAAYSLRHELMGSVLLAALGATIVVLPAAGLAWYMWRDRRGRWLVSAPLVLLLATPAPVVGISLIGLLDRPGAAGVVYDSPLVVSVAFLVRFLPIGVLLLLPAVQRVPRELEWAARVDGCDWLGVHWHVRWPALRTDAAIAWLVVMILSFGEIGATMLVARPGWPMAAITAFQLIHFGVYRDLAVLAVLSAAFIVLPWGLLQWLVRGRSVA